MLYDNNLIEMSLRLNRSEPIFRTIIELPGNGRRPRTRDDIRQSRNLPYNFMIVRQKPTQTFIFRILLAMNSRSQIVFLIPAVLYKTYLKNVY